MASSRRRGRGGRRRPPADLRGTLGTLLRTTLHQVGMLKDAVERQARSSRDRIDAVLLERKRSEALAALGEAILEMSRAGELGDLEEVPEIREILTELEYFDQQREDDRDEVSAAEWTAAPRRARFDRRGERGRDDDELRVWRPVVDDDGTVSALGQKRDAEAPREQEEATPHGEPKETAPRGGRGRRRTRGSGAGGIAFVDDPADSLDDDDLADYMHPDDVPPKK